MRNIPGIADPGDLGETHMIIRTLATASLAVMLMSSAAYAASDYLLELGDVKGESKTKFGGGGGAGGGSGGQIEIQSFSWGASNPTSVGSSGMSAGKAAAPAAPPAGPGTIVVTTSGATAKCATGKHFANAALTARTGKYTLEDVTVTACDVHGDPHVQEMSYGKVSFSDLSIMSSPTQKKGAH
jgi:hypothetical protein